MKDEKKNHMMSEEQNLAFDRAHVQLAFANGAQIQRRVREMKWEWVDDPSPTWDWVMYEYRVKPDPDYGPLEEGDILPGSLLRRPNAKLPVLVLGLVPDAVAVYEHGQPLGYHQVLFVTYQALFDDKWCRSFDGGQSFPLCLKMKQGGNMNKVHEPSWARLVMLWIVVLIVTAVCGWCAWDLHETAVKLRGIVK